MGRTRIALLAVLVAAAALLPTQTAAADPDPRPVAPGLINPSPSPSPDPSSPAPSPTPEPTDSSEPAPAAPTGPGAVRDIGWQSLQGGARLRWSPPDGAASGTTYTVVVAPAGAGDRFSARSVDTARTDLVVPAVPAGTRLTATVTASADGVAGPTVSAPTWVQPDPVPDAPGSATLELVPGSSSLRVGWTPPAIDGPALTGFVVELHTVADPAAVAVRRTAAADARTLDLSGLAPGTRYFATVAAVNAAGTGAGRETPTAVLPTATACTPCSTSAAQVPAVSARPAPARSKGTAGARPTAAPAAGAPVPVASGVPLHLALGIGGIVVAAVLAITAVLLRRRSAVG